MTKNFRFSKILSIIGPGFITASVVIGPGSISTNSWLKNLEVIILVFNGIIVNFDYS